MRIEKGGMGVSPTPLWMIAWSGLVAEVCIGNLGLKSEGGRALNKCLGLVHDLLFLPINMRLMVLNRVVNGR